MVNAGSIFSNVWNGLSTDFKKKNFSLYGQWLAILSMLLAFTLGFANIFSLSLIIAFGIICVVQGFVVLFVEMPFLLKICPLSAPFINFISKFDENLPRCGFYLLMAAIQYLSLVDKASSLLVVAIFFTFTSASYGLAVLKHQDFEKSTIQIAGAPDTVQGQVGAQIARNVL